MNRFSNTQEESADTQGVVLLLQVPRTNDKKELAAEQMFASLHGLLTQPSHKMFQAAQRERISFEIAVLKKRIGFYVWVPQYLKSFVEEQVYAQYPMVQISEIPDYSTQAEQEYSTVLSTEMKLVNNDALPIKTFQSFEVDPLAAITATLAKFEDSEEAWIQLVLKPAASNWHRRSERYVAGLRGKTKGSGGGALLSALWAAPTDKGPEAAKLTEYEQARASGAEEKSHKLAYETSVRIVYRGSTPLQTAKLRLQSIIASYKQFNTTYLNGFEQRSITQNPALVEAYRARVIIKRGLILNIEEV
ncbi:MAG TPA: hypothetical protein VLG13_02085, partial [Patescibacteria group bacterium]|nr:hypothetical protein [Patescibacteria group bacterium]